jgi:hypothetical protein
MTKKAIRILIFIGIIAWESACGAPPHSDCAKDLKEEIRPGLSSELADAQLKKCGFKTTLDPAKNTLFGDKRIGNGVVLERTQVVIDLNADNTVARVSVSTGLIGP